MSQTPARPRPRQTGHLVHLLVIMVCLGLPALLGTRPVYAATLTVNIAVDETDGACNTDVAPAASDCSLRDAVDAASSIAVDTIAFDAAIAAPVEITLGEISVNKSVTIDGDNQRITLKSASGRIFNISDGAVTLTGLTMVGDEIANFGGGIVNSATGAGNVVTISNSHFSNNRAFVGGAINNSGTMVISGSTFDYNSGAPGDGGAIANSGTLSIGGTRFQYNDSSASGGSLYSSAGTLTLSDCLIGDSDASDGLGGGVYISGGTAGITNCTVTGNNAEDANNGGGGGIAVTNGTVSVTLTTIVDNVAAAGGTALGGGGIVNTGGVVNLRGTLISGNTNTGGAAADLVGAFNSEDYNLIRTPGTATIGGATANNITGQDPLLGAPAVYGAANGLETYALLPGSPAIDAAVCPGTVTTDQRGIARGTSGDTPCDIGAFESRGFGVAAASGTPQSAAISTAFAAPLVVTVSSTFNEPVAGGVVRYTSPATGASTTPAATTATVAVDGSASANVTANANAGTYSVSAGGKGFAAPASFSLTNLAAGYGSNPAPGSTLDLGSAVINTAVDVPALLSVSETGDLALSVTDATVSGPNAADFLVTPTTLTIPDGGPAQNLSISCTPFAVGTRTATLTVTHNAGAAASYTLICAGTLAPTPGYSSNPAPGSTIDFGTSPIGVAVSKAISVSENGTAQLDVTGATISGPAAADFLITPTTVTIINGGAAQILALSCTPSKLGTRTATLSLTHNAASNPTVYTLTCSSAGMWLPLISK